TRIIAATAVTGFVIDATRKIVSRFIGVDPPTAVTPIGSTCVSPRRCTSATPPGAAPRSTWAASTSCMRSRRSFDRFVMSAFFEVRNCSPLLDRAARRLFPCLLPSERGLVEEVVRPTDLLQPACEHLVGHENALA